MKKLKLSEDNVISLAERFFSTPSKKIIKGIGDDTAVLKGTADFQLFTSDILIEGTHFLFKKIRPYDLGWKSMAVNISDIAAMGGRPSSAVLSLAINEKISLEWLENFYRGMAECCKKYSMQLVGGDTVYSRHTLVINIALLGETRKPVYRDSAKPGFVLVSTGKLGLSGAGFWVLQNRKKPFSAEEQYCLNRHTYPIPRVEEAAFISGRTAVLAMLDCSDGLYTSAKILSEKSGLGLELSANCLPVSASLKEVASQAGIDPLEFILYGGEDYELIIAMPEESYKKIRKEYQQTFNSELFCLGRFNTQKNIISLKHNKTGKILEDRGFKHFEP